MVESLLMVDLLTYPAGASQLVLQRPGMCYPLCQMVHIKDPLLLIEMSSPCSVGSGFLF